MAGPDHAEQAVAAARAVQPAWGALSARDRAAVLVRTAAIMRARRFELAAWEVYECGKPWAEADGDVAEAIDFCEFYAREVVRLSQPRHRDAPGETNFTEHLPRGVAAIIPPWNFPLAIPTGMTVAALAAGNAALIKPAEQSPVMAWHLARALLEAGLPPGVLSFLPGVGEEIGQALVNHPGVDVIAFTGSRDVGLLINRQGAEVRPGQDHVKRVIAEMGGKNAIILDDDADLDEAVVGVIHSAFGYSGQKCSACSRVIALEGIHDAFLARLVERGAGGHGRPGRRPRDAGRPRDRRRRAAANPRLSASRRHGGTRRLPGRSRPDRRSGILRRPDDRRRRRARVPHRAGRDLRPGAGRAQGEGPGRSPPDRQWDPVCPHRRPVLAEPGHIEKVRREFRVGNLYINRGITGALVDRQPFGGFKLSGIGTKAGGPDYLLEFLLTRCVTENTMRRGFAPEDVASLSGK